MSTCPRCGSNLSDQPGAPCPRCLMELALEPQTPGPSETTLPTPPAADLGSVGPYRLLAVLGEGGMGTVYLAEQREPIQRRVALKVVRAGLAGKEALARFEAERQALALMTHPGIARVLDAGTTETGAPYFAMEYVHGEPINAYCDKKRLSTAERIDLFRAVCAAVQHAHQRGILHRDLKPSNILVEEVDGKPQPRVIDFGLAKALNQRLTERTLFTERGAIVGTPEYMSPEQAAGEAFDVDTTTDVYSLGVVLYELLTGSLPHDPQKLREAGWLGMMKMLREDEPKKPSTQVSTFNEETASAVAGKRKTEPRSLRRSLTGDLDWIVLKALDKERERRYPNVSDLAADLERHLGSVPVSASPPSAWYRARKFGQRHRVGVATSALISVLLLISLALALRQLAVGKEQRVDAQSRLEAEQLVSDFNLDLLERFSSASVASGSGWRSEQASAAAATFEKRVAARSLAVQTRALVSAASVLYDLELKTLAAVLLRRSLSMQESSKRVRRLELAGTLYLLSVVGGDSPDALDQITRSYALYRDELGDEHPVTADAYCELAGIRMEKARSSSDFSLDPASAAAFEREASRCFELTARGGAASDRLLARRLTQFGFFLQFAASRDAAREHLRRAAAILRPLGEESRWQLAETLQILATFGDPSGQADPTKQIFREACALREATGGSGDRETAHCNLAFGAFLIDTGAREEGIALRSRAIEALWQQYGRESEWMQEFARNFPVDGNNYQLEFSWTKPSREDARRAFARARQQRE